MILSEKDIIEKARFLILDQEAGARAPSFLCELHDENAIALTEMLDSYMRLKMFERLSLRITGMSLTELLGTAGTIKIEPKEFFRAKYLARAKENREAKS